ncbi:hypothetical protein [Tenacibaculum sp. 190130A14a]|uniref:Uncharacterized protein n=1 Tax=Tenacibaculum polynesiense TaxID=3137857 RepID=A0ABM9PE57_9FLAO
MKNVLLTEMKLAKNIILGGGNTDKTGGGSTDTGGGGGNDGGDDGKF